MRYLQLDAFCQGDVKKRQSHSTSASGLSHPYKSDLEGGG